MEDAFFTRYYARFAGTHGCACSHSNPHVYCVAIACFRFMRAFANPLFALFALHSFAHYFYGTLLCRVNTDYSDLLYIG